MPRQAFLKAFDRLKRERSEAVTTKRSFRRLSVSLVAAEAGHPRSILYSTYPEIVAEIRDYLRTSARKVNKRKPSQLQQCAKLRLELEAVREQRDQLASQSYSLLDRALTAERLVDELRPQLQRTRAR